MARENLIPPGRNSQRIFEAMCEHPYGITMGGLISRVWENPDDEPNGPEGSLSVCICKMNRWWRERGIKLRIKGHGGPGSIFQVWIGPFR